ncbi:MAG: FeoA family protein [Anaerovoracaceae bacterium]|jgi:ferrous iron transport protein A
MKLNLGRPEHYYRIKSMRLREQIKQHLEALGMTSGTPVEVMNNKSGGTLIIKVRGTRFAVGKNISENIEVEEI